ncbi:MAG: Phospholipase C [Trizodia sp. TS-e1964]|nr:MAG: Phospholipase C [Trizodia sp. TS-e1964]
MHRPEVRDIFQARAHDPHAGLDYAEFTEFLRVEQGVDVSLHRAHWDAVFDKFARMSSPLASNEPPRTGVEQQQQQQLRSGRIGRSAFAEFLSSPLNAVLAPLPDKVLLDRPMNEYYISSSHNTYLLGRQVAGESSVEPYIRALRRGCRCVEVDCWDGAEGRPVVNHGRTLTSKVPFADVIQAIGRYAFVASPYPLIISLEVHCCAEQQRTMADILKATLGPRLILEPLPGKSTVLPSPEDLKHRILIKVKAPDEPPELATGSESFLEKRSRSFSSPFSKPLFLDNTNVPSSPLAPVSPVSPVSPGASSPELLPTGSGARSPVPTGTGNSTSVSSLTDDSDSRETAHTIEAKRKKKLSKIVKPLGDLGVYTRGQKYSNFGLPESKTYNHIFSLAERTFEAVCRDAEVKARLEKHNMRYWMRVYPSGFRINSSNFDPITFWRRGVQMVALNWQTYDTGQQKNDAMFAAGSDRTGYVLKSQDLRQSINLEPAATSPPKKHKKLVKFSIQVISAQHLPRPNGTSADQLINPYVEIETFCADDRAKGVASGEGGQDASARNGMSGIGSPHRRRTRIVPNNGYNPIFNDKLSVSLETKLPSLVFVRWTVRTSHDARSFNEKNNLIGTFTAKLSSLEVGYRHLPLSDHTGEPLPFAALFCKIVKEEIIPVEREAVEAVRTGSLKQFGRSVFSRTLSVDKRKPKNSEAREQIIASRDRSHSLPPRAATEPMLRTNSLHKS